MGRLNLDIEKAELVVQSYETLENRLLDFIKIIPPRDDNLHVWSPELADIIIGTCALLDSVFRHVAPPRYQHKKKRIKRGDCKIADFARIFSRKIEISILKSIVLIPPPYYLTPFSVWKNALSAKQVTSPAWWTVHNKLKHDKLENIKKATLQVAIEALCGLSQVISRHHDLLEAIYRKNWLKLGGYNPDLAFRDLREQDLVDESFFVETQLFALSLNRRGWPDNLRDFRPAIHAHGGSLHLLFGRWL